MGGREMDPVSDGRCCSTAVRSHLPIHLDVACGVYVCVSSVSIDVNDESINALFKFNQHTCPTYS